MKGYSTDSSASIIRPFLRSSADDALSLRILLAQGARGQHSPWCLSRALQIILNRHGGTGPNRLVEEYRDELVEMLRTIRWTSLCDLPSYIGPEIVEEGIEAAGQLVLYWAQDPVQRCAYYPDHVRDWLAYAGALQHLCEAASLVEEIGMRGEQRATKGVVMLSAPLMFGSKLV
jgi:hypothetical protein